MKKGNVSLSQTNDSGTSVNENALPCSAGRGGVKKKVINLFELYYLSGSMRRVANDDAGPTLKQHWVHSPCLLAVIDR